MITERVDASEIRKGDVLLLLPGVTGEVTHVYPHHDKVHVTLNGTRERAYRAYDKVLRVPARGRA